MEQELSMYLFVNTDLKMEKGKIAGQVGHAVQIITEKILRLGYESRNIPECYVRYNKWSRSGAKKVVLKATQQQMEQLLNLDGHLDECITVIDAGRTQIEPNSMTVVGFFPTYDKKISEGFKLL